jgi:phage terminase small subunit
MQGRTLKNLSKPPNIANDSFKSAKWDELTAGRAFAQSDAPALALLCQWYKLAQQAMDELDNFGSQTAYQNDMGDLKAFPQIGTLKQCSNEIRQLNKQLGICDTHEEAPQRDADNVLRFVQRSRAKRAAGA